MRTDPSYVSPYFSNSRRLLYSFLGFANLRYFCPSTLTIYLLFFFQILIIVEEWKIRRLQYRHQSTHNLTHSVGTGDPVLSPLSTTAHLDFFIMMIIVLEVVHVIHLQKQNLTPPQEI